MDLEHGPAELDPESWVRAVGFATASPDVGEALRGILAEAVQASGAAAGAVAQLERLCCRAAWGCDPAEIEPLLRPEGAVAAALARGAPWPKGPLLLSEPHLPIGSNDGEPGRLLLAPLRSREVVIGCLLLVYRGEAEPTPAQWRGVAGFAGLVALVLDSDRLFEEARRARQARDHFLTAIHHELRTPATAFMLHAGLLQTGHLGDLPPRLQRTVETLESDISELVRVIASVLSLARLEADSAPAGTDVVNPRELVLELLRRVEPTVERKQLSLAVFLPRMLPVMQTDAERLRRILLHLFANAIKFTEEGGIEVRVERSVRAVGGRRREPMLIVSVSDTGRGVPAAEIERIFEPFAQVDEGARTDSESRGVGLGLTLARKLARSLGGEVVVESTEGEGTVATLLLPYRTGAPE
ncbi:MAG TPA: HAMP domain-containing sensor histidine kinase [Longimicrobiaceae bacterium]|nr:HAMP domain-containing sensor histidine kinase [Longimicrobiaceae bacterium]